MRAGVVCKFTVHFSTLFCTTRWWITFHVRATPVHQAVFQGRINPADRAVALGCGIAFFHQRVHGFRQLRIRLVRDDHYI
jgi:hypothetical protein